MSGELHTPNPNEAGEISSSEWEQRFITAATATAPDFDAMGEALKHLNNPESRRKIIPALLNLDPQTWGEAIEEWHKAQASGDPHQLIGALVQNPALLRAAMSPQTREIAINGIVEAVSESMGANTVASAELTDEEKAEVERLAPNVVEHQQGLDRLQQHIGHITDINESNALEILSSTFLGDIVKYAYRKISEKDLNKNAMYSTAVAKALENITKAQTEILLLIREKLSLEMIADSLGEGNKEYKEYNDEDRSIVPAIFDRAPSAFYHNKISMFIRPGFRIIGDLGKKLGANALLRQANVVVWWDPAHGMPPNDMLGQGWEAERVNKEQAEIISSPNIDQLLGRAKEVLEHPNCSKPLLNYLRNMVLLSEQAPSIKWAENLAYLDKYVFGPLPFGLYIDVSHGGKEARRLIEYLREHLIETAGNQIEVIYPEAKITKYDSNYHTKGLGDIDLTDDPNLVGMIASVTGVGYIELEHTDAGVNKKVIRPARVRVYVGKAPVNVKPSGGLVTKI